MTKSSATPAAEPAEQRVEETPFEAVAGICSVLVVGLFILTFLAQNMVIPSGSMEDTLLVGDHLVVDRITFAPPAHWMPLVHYREPRRGDIVVFIKPVAGRRKRRAGISGSGQAPRRCSRRPHSPARRSCLCQRRGAAAGADGQDDAQASTRSSSTSFPQLLPSPSPAISSRTWEVDFHNHVVNGDLVVPPGMYFMMGDNRHNSADSRFWGFVPREISWAGRCSITGRSRRRGPVSRRAGRADGVDGPRGAALLSAIPAGAGRSSGSADPDTIIEMHLRTATPDYARERGAPMASTSVASLPLKFLEDRWDEPWRDAGRAGVCSATAPTCSAPICASPTLPAATPAPRSTKPIRSPARR